jgi:hypothetical protein
MVLDLNVAQNGPAALSCVNNNFVEKKKWNKKDMKKERHSTTKMSI